MNEKGFSVLQVIIAAGLMGFLAVMMMKLSERQAKDSALAQSSVEENFFLGHINTLLLKQSSCEKTMEDVSVGQTLSSITYVKDNGDEVAIYETGKTYGNNNIALTSLKLIEESGLYYIEIQWERIKKIIKGPKNKTKKIPLQVILTDGKVSSCFSDQSNTVTMAISKSCEAFGAIYNPSTLKCEESQLNEETNKVCDNKGENCQSINDYVQGKVDEKADLFSTAASICKQSHPGAFFIYPQTCSWVEYQTNNNGGWTGCKNTHTCPDATFMKFNSHNEPSLCGWAWEDHYLCVRTEKREVTCTLSTPITPVSTCSTPTYGSWGPIQ